MLANRHLIAFTVAIMLLGVVNPKIPAHAEDVAEDPFPQVTLEEAQGDGGYVHLNGWAERNIVHDASVGRAPGETGGVLDSTDWGEAGPAEAQAQCGYRLDSNRVLKYSCWMPVSRPATPLPDGEPATPPSTQTLIYTAATNVEISGAGLQTQPKGQAVVGIPQLVHVTKPEQSHTVAIFGQPVTINLTATEFSFDFGDGSAPLVTSNPGAPYPDMTNQHTYVQRQEGAVITLTTTWAGTVSNPFTGETMTIQGLLRTTESTAPFTVRKAQIHLTDTAEELAGH